LISIPERFTRDYGCSVDDWLRWLPGAVQSHALQRPAAGSAVVELAPGRAHLSWTVQPERRIALVRLPRLAVRFEFDGVAAEARAAFMRHFDLYMQRGGG
jgi:hypothetical protein